MMATCAFALPTCVFWILLVFSTYGDCFNKQSFTAPLQEKPFVIIWNVPTERCESKFNVRLPLFMFDLVSTPRHNHTTQSVMMFYENHLGTYPFYTKKGEPVHGGLPHNASLLMHIRRVQRDLKALAPTRTSTQLAVIDWEEWRPQWIRNWNQKDIYRRESVKLVRQKHPSWDDEWVNQQAQWEFETAAQHFMEETLRLGKNFYKQALWGFYLYPDCYNYNYKKEQKSYTGYCPEVERRRNEELDWLWRSSTALFPSIYMEQELQNSENGRKFVQNRVKEALRVADLARVGHALPVFVYTQPVYAYTFIYKSEKDLMHSIGESAALGAAGIILWGDVKFSQSREDCEGLQSFLEGKLGKYLVNVSEAASQCSQLLCNAHGRCVRNKPDSHAYLHLPATRFSVYRHAKGFGVDGYLRSSDVWRLRSDFHCSCYVGWRGRGCDRSRASSIVFILPANVLLVTFAFVLQLTRA
uniref:hyaluronidase-1-like n=1 Tax=Myxine glutinosa TaxID=7769 RepID=UPI00358EAA76